MQTPRDRRGEWEVAHVVRDADAGSGETEVTAAQEGEGSDPLVLTAEEVDYVRKLMRQKGGVQGSDPGPIRHVDQAELKAH